MPAQLWVNLIMDSLASLSNNAKKDFRLRGKCAAPCSPLGPARQSCGLAAAQPAICQGP